MTRSILFLLTLVVTISLATSAVARADTLRIYRGDTSQTRPTPRPEGRDPSDQE